MTCRIMETEDWIQIIKQNADALLAFGILRNHSPTLDGALSQAKYTGKESEVSEVAHTMQPNDAKELIQIQSSELESPPTINNNPD